MQYPSDFSRGVKRYLEFHQLEPKHVGQISITIPDQAWKVGKATHVAYRSDKWEGKNHDYWHDHDGGCSTYRLDDDSYDGRICKVPGWLSSTSTIVLLGECLGFSYTDFEGVEIEGKTSKPYPELYCTPNGKALLVVTHKRTIHVMVWGGSLSVTERGIVG